MDALLADSVPGPADRSVDGGGVAPKVGDIWYRYDDRTYAGAYLDQYDNDHYYTTTEVQVTRFKVLRVTPKGVRLIGAGYGKQNARLVLHDSYKRFACSTQAEALESYIRRKMKQAAIYEARAKKASECLRMAKAGRVKMCNDPERLYI